MRVNTAEIILCLDAGQSFCFEERSEHVLESFELRTEALQNLCAGVGPARLAPFEQEALNFLLHLDRRQVR